MSEAEKRVKAIERNTARRQLTDAQRVVLAEKIEPDLRSIAQQRQIAAGVHGADGGRGNRKEDKPLLPNENKGLSAPKSLGLAAKEVGLSQSTYYRGKRQLEQVREVAPAAFGKLSGTVPLSA